MSNFEFLTFEFKPLSTLAQAVEQQVHTDPRAACMRCRHALERTVHWLYDHDRDLRRPYDRSLNALVSQPDFRQLLGDTVWEKVRLIQKLGNEAVHGNKPIKAYLAQHLCQELFHILYWLARNYARQAGARPQPGLSFDAALLPRLVNTQEAVAFTQAELKKLQAQHAEESARWQAEAEQREAEVARKLADIAARQAELDKKERHLSLVEQRQQALHAVAPALATTQVELANAKQAVSREADSHDYHEADTRKHLIDVLLREAGWAVGEDAGVEVPVTGMPNNQGKGFVDYVLWGADGKPLAVVEAKRSLKDPETGKQQAKLYADCLEQMKGQRPIIFYSNGYQTWLWDDCQAAPRQVQGFYTRNELAQLITRRDLAKDPAKLPVRDDIVERYYQKRAIKAIGEAFNQGQRAALLTMATGTGKTRTAIALADVLMRANLVKRVLFLADRVALVNQATNAFKAHLPDSSPVNLVTEKNEQGRVYLCTYPTMMGLIEDKDTAGGKNQRRFGIGHFDLIIIDEAHRSVYQKYQAIFNYFDSYLVGLTATPRDEVHRDTYALFGLEKGVPTDAYSLEQAVADNYLVPPKAFDVPLKFVREGIKYNELSAEDQEYWEGLDWGELDEAPGEVSASAINKFLFNSDTVDKMLAHLMTQGLKVEAGDKLGKTIIFAVNQKHADFIVQRFDHNYPHLKGHFARTITHAVNYAQSLIEDFGKAASNPQIAVSVDMLDTGIDVPEVLNLVFFKAVRSKVKFLQMVGRGTRLSKDLFAPGEHKTEFAIFDYCENFTFFNENPDGYQGAVAEPLGKRLFAARAELLAKVQQRGDGWVNPTLPQDSMVADSAALGASLKSQLHDEVSQMNLDNFIVRPKGEYVRYYSDKSRWDNLTADDLGRLTTHVAGLPSALEQGHISAKLFDLNCLYAQLAIVEKSPQLGSYQSRIMQVAADLEAGCAAVPVVKAQLELIAAVQEQDYWIGVTVEQVETIRLRLRDLLCLIEKKKQALVYTVLQDVLGDATAVQLLDTNTGINLPQYRKKVERFIQSHRDHITIARLRQNKPLTPRDLAELERFIFEEGDLGSKADFAKAYGEQPSLAAFIRGLVGLERKTALAAFAQFLDEASYNATQIRFVNMIIDHLEQHGVIDPGMLYEPPFSGVHYEGVDGVFTNEAQVQALFAVIDELQQDLSA